MALRVIQFSTGNVGRHSLRSLIERPDFELVGVHASSPAKVGLDAAELCGLEEPTGVLATDNLDDLVSLRADCVVYTTRAETRPNEAIEELSAFLSTGTNVVATSLVWLVFPPHADAWLRDPLTQACLAGGSTMYVNGVDPGFSGDLLPLAALSLTERAEIDPRSRDLRLRLVRRRRVHRRELRIRHAARRTFPYSSSPECSPRSGAVRSGCWQTSSASRSTSSASTMRPGWPRSRSTAR